MERYIEGLAEEAQASSPRESEAAESEALWKFVREDAEQHGKPVETYLQDLVARAYALDREFGEELARRPDIQEKIARDREEFLERVRRDYARPPEHPTG